MRFFSIGIDRISSIKAPGVRLVGRALAVLFVALIASAADFAKGAELQTLEIASKTGVHAFQVEMAITPEEKEHGLMFRRELPDGQGMLFDFQFDQNVAFWMKNTRIPLDMLFFDADRHLVSAQHNVPPCTADPCPAYSSGAPARYVLELNGGQAGKLGLSSGDEMTIHR